MDATDAKVTIPALQQMKRDGRKIIGVVAWDYQIARIVDRVGVDVVSVGDTVGVNLWGQSNPLEVTMDQMVLVCQAVRRGVQRALVSCDFPYGPLQEGTGSAVRAAIRLVKQARVDLVKLDGAADFLDAVTAIARAGIPVFAQLGITPQTALRYGVEYGAMSRPGAEVLAELAGDLVAEAKRLEEAGASLLDFTNSGPIVGPQVTRAAAIGYAASALDDPPDTYANVAKIAFEAITDYVDDVRAGRQIRGGAPAPSPRMGRDADDAPAGQPAPQARQGG